MKRKDRLRKGVIVLAGAALMASGVGSTGNEITLTEVYGAEAFTDGAGLDAAAAFSEEAMEPAEPEPTAIPEPTAVPEPTIVPEPTNVPEVTPTPGVSVHIDNLNVYTNQDEENDESDSGVFVDGEEWLEGTASGEVEEGAVVSSGGFSGGYSGDGGAAEQTEELIRQPKLLLESCNLSGQALKAGSEAEMKMVFRNKSAGQGIYNLKVSLATESSSIQFQQKSFYYGKVSAGGSIELQDKIKIAVDAKDGPIPIVVTFEYEDVKGTAVTGTEGMELQTVQPVLAELDCDDMPVLVYSTDTVNLSARVMNLSRTGIYNVRVSLEGTGLFPKEEIFVGNMEPGVDAEGTMRVFVGTRTMTAIGQDEGTQESEMYGDVNGTITLSYEDAQGNVYSEKKEYQTEIRKPEIKKLKVEEPKEANSWWYSVLVVAGAGMVLLISGLMMRLRRQRILLEEARREAAGAEK